MDELSATSSLDSPTPRLLSNSENVIEEIRSWIQLDVHSKFHEDAVKHIESIVVRQLSCLETTLVERLYVKVVLEMWLKGSLRKAIDYLKDETIDISTQMADLLLVLNSISSFEDIGLKRSEATCHLTALCDGECQYLNLILDQADLFKNSPRFTVLVASYFKQFKMSCIDKVFCRCMYDIGKDQIHSERNCEFILALTELFQVAGEDVTTQNILETDVLENDITDLSNANGQDLINKLVATFKSCSNLTGSESAEWLDQLKSEKEWTPKLQVLVKEMCKAFLLPKTTIEVIDEYGRKIIFIKGVAVFVSHMIDDMKRLKASYPEVQEIQIVGLSSVHIDCHLENEIWHGTNVGIVTGKLFVDHEVCQNGQQTNDQTKVQNSEKTIDDDDSVNSFLVCWDISGENGEAGEPGLSGGNLHVICTEMINAERWKIIADGGDGSDGHNGSDGEIKTKGKAHKWSEAYFKQVFPSMSTFNTGEQANGDAPKDAVNTVLTTLKDFLPVEDRTYGERILPGYKQQNFVIDGTAKDGSTIYVSFYRSVQEKHTFICCKGSTVGQGGYGGSITFEFMNAKDSFAIESSVPVVGKENRQARAVRMGVYQAMGFDGKMGTPVGDVAFIHCLDTSKASASENLIGRYIGFENDVSLKMEISSKRPKKQPNDTSNYYAKISSSNNSIPEYRRVHYGDQSPSNVINASKTKSIVRRSLTQYVVQVSERTQMTQRLLSSLSSNWEEETLADNVDLLVSQMKDQETQLHELTLQCSRGLENIETTTRFVKPAFEQRLDVNCITYTSRSSGGQRSVGRRPVDFRQEPTGDVRCLDMLPTTGGVDSAIHSIFGQVNSKGLYVCNDVKTFRHQLATFIRTKENFDKISALIMQFVMRVQKSDKLDCRIASEVKLAYFKFRRENDEGNEFNWKNETEKVAELFEEYAKFVETPSNPLESAEVDMLAVICGKTIIVYSDQSSSFKYKETLNPSNSKKLCMLHHGNGEWQRVEPNEMVEYFKQKIDDDLFEYQSSIQSNFFRKFLNSLEKQGLNQEVIVSMKKLNPENGDTPDTLFQFLFERFQKDEENPEDLNPELIKESSTDLGWLLELVEEHNCRNLSPIFYLNIVKHTLPVNWICEFFMLEIFDEFTQQDALDIHAIASIRERLYEIAADFPSLVFLLRKLVAISESSAVFKPQNLLRLLELIANDCKQRDGITRQLLPELQLLPLNDWFYHIRSKMWERKVNVLPTDPTTESKEKKKLGEKAAYSLLELECKNGVAYCETLLIPIEDMNALQKTLDPGGTPNHEFSERNVDEIITMMKEDNKDNSETAITKTLTRGTEMNMLLDNVKEEVEKSKSKLEKLKAFEKEPCKLIQKRIKNWQKNGLNLTTSVANFVYVYDYAVQKICTRKEAKEPFRLRDTQRVAITTLLTSKNQNQLIQVSTGEGKSLIVCGVAIAFALCRNENKRKKKIDIIASNDVLARRDSMLSVADGGLRDLYEYFHVSLANNCSKSADERTEAYNSAVVYGQLANFQRDYLLDKFYGRSIRGDRTMDLLIMDEVDCMLLDGGSNTLYLSHDIPGMEMLEPLYVFIWENICSSAGSDKPAAIRESVKSAVLYDLHGVINKGDLESIRGSLKYQPSDKNALWDYLVETKVIDPQGRLLMEDRIKNIDFELQDFELINFESEKQQMKDRIVFYLRSVAQRERNIRIQEHLMPFVDRNLDTWIDNALYALELKRDEDYVVDQDRTDTSPDLNPQVIIIDKDTGMDQTSSQWGGALHQFVQLKMGCKLTSQSLKAIFISNSSYVKFYQKVVGVSGTLGSETERQFLRTNYRSMLLVIPKALQRRFYLKPTKVFTSKYYWLRAIVKETLQITNEGRSLVIFCQSIKDVNSVHGHLMNALKPDLNDNHIHCYTRDYEKFVFEGKPLDVGHVIIATNLAGRGTDIKISEELKANGGLHICLTFLPKNERIEEQATGRTARNGAPGSGRFLLYEESYTSTGKWGAGKWLSMKEERQWKESQRVSRLKGQLTVIKWEEKLFGRFEDHYNRLKEEFKDKRCDDHETKTIFDSVLDKWALWLDQIENHSHLLTFVFNASISENFDTALGLPESNDIKDTSWMTPVRSIAMAKHLAMQKSSLPTALEILNRVIDSKDGYFYPAAHYYLAFIFFKEDFKDNKTKFIRILQTCETILNNHVDMHLSFYQKIAHDKADQAPSFCVVDAYKQQKHNMVKILEYFIGSVRALLGSHYCSASNLKEAGHDAPEKLDFEKKIMKKVENFMKESASYFPRFQKNRKPKGEPKCHRIDPEKAEKLFQSLVKANCVSCQLNDTDIVPNRNNIVQQVANEYGIKKLLENLEPVFGQNLIEDEIEKKLKKENLIKCTRKAFWEELKNQGALEAVKGGLCPEMTCVIMLESECDVEPVKSNAKKLDLNDQIKTEVFQFGLDSLDFEHNCLNVLYNPMYASMNDLLKQKKIMFSKQYVTEQLGREEYRHRKDRFEFNKIAQLNLDKLETVDLKLSGPLGKADLARANITSNGERDLVWKALIDQKIIDSNGKLSSNYQTFSYKECPAYEDPVMRVVSRTFVAEIVKRQWQRAATQDPHCLKAINLLPLKPYRDMLGDLMAAHVISGARVTEKAEFIEEKTKEIEDDDERECVRKFLKSRQAVYVPRLKKYNIFLDFIEADIRKIPRTNNISTELHIFDLVGFNHVIDIKDREMSWKNYLAPMFAGAVGVASIGAGAFLIHEKLLSFGLSKNLLLMGGLSDILYGITTILTRSTFTWADYTRQRLRSAMGKTEPIETIKAIGKLCSSSENAEFRESIKLPIGSERWKRQGRNQMNGENEVLHGRSIALTGVMSQETECYFHCRLDCLCQTFGISLLGKIKRCVTKNSALIRETLAQFNDVYGLEISRRFVRQKMNQLIAHWHTQSENWIHAVVTVVSSKLDEIHDKILQNTGGIPLTREVADEGIHLIDLVFSDCEVRMELIRVTLKRIHEFLLALNNLANPEVPRAKDVDVEQFNRFQKKLLIDIDSELERKAEKIMESFKQQTHQVASDQVTNLANTNREIFSAFWQLS